MAATIRGAAASRHFTKALIDLAVRGLRTYCSNPESHHLWLSEDEQERAAATQLCSGCPVQLECWSAANARNEKFGVWGGVDRTKVPAKAGAAS
jgi:Transcription factor WhiB